MGLYGLVQDKVALFAIGIVVAMGSITYPAISALLSRSATAEQQVWWLEKLEVRTSNTQTPLPFLPT